MNTVLHKAATRGHANHGWLDTNHTFSFAHYYDPTRTHFGKLRVLNDDFVDGGMGFGTHPHDNMEIISIPLAGDLEHTGKPDLDNLAKLVLDAANGILWDDDSQIIKLHLSKMYSGKPGYILIIEANP